MQSHTLQKICDGQFESVSDGFQHREAGADLCVLPLGDIPPVDPEAVRHLALAEAGLFPQVSDSPANPDRDVLP